MQQRPADAAPSRDEIIDRLSGFALFADLSTPQLRAIAHRLEEAFFAPGETILHQGLTGSGFYVILEGKASVRIDGVERNVLVPGDFFGEISILLEEPPSADVVATTELRCLILPGGQIQDFLLAQPRVTYRMLQAEARKLRNASKWRS